MDEIKLADNVLEFLIKASNDYGRIKSIEFYQNMRWELTGGDMGSLKTRSPIEHMLYVATRILCESESIAFGPDKIFHEIKKEWVDGCGLFLCPQYKIGKYRVDFLIRRVAGDIDNRDISEVVVELDGHDFHDKDKIQRAYEKRRDRFLVSSGFRVLHFTGSEVVADPYKVAFEALSVLFPGMAHEYDPNDPLRLQ